MWHWLRPSKGYKKTYLKPREWKLLPEILWEADNVLELAALGEGEHRTIGVNVRQSRPQIGKDLERQSPFKTHLLSRIKIKAKITCNHG